MENRSYLPFEMCAMTKEIDSPRSKSAGIRERFQMPSEACGVDGTSLIAAENMIWTMEHTISLEEYTAWTLQAKGGMIV